MNSVTLRGGLTRDPETRDFNGTMKVDLMLAVNGTRYDKNVGTQVVKTIFVSCEAWAAVADELIGYALEKGDELYLTGELSQYRKDEDDRPHTRVTVFDFTVLRKRSRAPKPVESDTAPAPVDDPWAMQ